ncbi:hypothetical protein D3C76_1838760 [compost metagenome]
MNQKFIIKFEQGNLEQSYKIAGVDITGGVNGVFELLVEEFLKSVIDQFSLMRQSFNGAYSRYE